MRRVRNNFLPPHSRLYLGLALATGLPLWALAQTEYGSGTSAATTAPGAPLVPGTVALPQGASNSYAVPRGFRGQQLSQTKLRASLTGWRAFRAAKLDEDAPQATTKVGDVYLTMAAGLRVEYNDNVNTSPNDPIGDFIITPEVRFRFYWPYAERNSLDFNLGLKYDYYLQRSDLNEPNFSIDPGTILQFRMFVGDFMFTLYDLPSIQNTPPPDLGVVNVVNFSQLQNTIGLAVTWDLNKLLLNARVERSDSVSLNNEFTSENSTTYNFALEAAYMIAPALQVGARGSVSQTSYQENVMNDFRKYEFGLFAEGRLTNYTTFSFEAGLQRYEYFDTGTQSSTGPVVEAQPTPVPTPAPTPDPVTGVVPPPAPAPAPVAVAPSSPVVVDQGGDVTNVEATAGGGDFFGPYFRFSLFNRLNRYYDHSLIVALDTQSSAISNFTQVFNVSYQFSWRIHNHVTVFGMLGAEYGKYSGNDTGSYINLEAALAIQYQLFRDMFLRLEYRFFNKIGYEEIEGYRQNRISFYVEYQF